MFRITPKQLPILIQLTRILRQGKISIADLQRKSNMKRTTLIYYLKILEDRGFIKKQRVEKGETGRPTLLFFDEKKYKTEQKEIEKRLEEEKETLLNHPLTFEILKLLNENPNPSLKFINEKTTDYFRKASHLSWLISEGYVVNEFKITPKGKSLLKQHSTKQHLLNK